MRQKVNRRGQHRLNLGKEYKEGNLHMFTTVELVCSGLYWVLHTLILIPDNSLGVLGSPVADTKKLETQDSFICSGSLSWLRRKLGFELGL